MQDIINPVLNRYASKSTNFPKEFTFLQILERVKFNLDSLKVLVADDIARHDHSIGLVSRNLLSDFITTGYVLLLSESDEDVYEKLYALYNSDLKKIESYLNVMKSAKFINDSEMAHWKDKFSDNGDIYKTIRDYCNDYNVKEFPRTAVIVKMFIDSNRNDIWSEQIKKSYDSWILYSKYEHLGWSSYHFTRQISAEKAKERLRSVLFKTSILVGSALEILNEQESLHLVMNISKGILQKKNS